MSFSDVHPDEMPSPDPFADPALATFLDDLEVVTTRPAPTPGPGLAAFFDGISPDIQLVDSQAPAAPRATLRRRKTVTELLAGLVAKLAGLGMAAKAGLGLGVAAASITTAGVANVLPDPAQHAVATVVNTLSTFDVVTDPSDEDEVIGGVEEGIEDVPVTDDVDVPELPENVELPDAGEGEGDGEGDGTGVDGAPLNHGTCVSAVARDKTATQGTPGSHGKAVSAVARSDCGKQTAGSPATTVPTTAVPTPTLDDSVGTSSNPGPANGNAGRGNGNAGRGNAANGSNGNSGNPGRR
ncbi:MAG: hypothetical protein M3O23_13220 [Actinomycetota bacterium]|nr:hypothetical protein [Actinomycetota bacterium]